ncbi:MAG TPA: undecaprenyl-diphosphate phosphatase [Candidatus Deferrimicrobium sp.]|nr:undecaprenyl-diphosphate phosphatase [Candidatus Deferrimicrobium sp.]
MNYLDAIILGIIQGLTEFLPVSSSGHLVLAQKVLGVDQPGISFEIVVHLGSLLAVVIFFRGQLLRLARSLVKRNMKEEHSLIGYLFIGTIPAAVAGFAFKDYFERAFSNPVTTSLELIITGVILFITRFFVRGTKPVGYISAALMGIGQAVAILPGISRSGTTIAAGLFAGVKPSEVAEFSFLLSIPAIFGAGLLEANELWHIKPELYGQYLAGGVISFVLSLAAVYTLLEVIKRGKLYWFAYYCFVAGAVGLYLFS